MHGKKYNSGYSGLLLILIGTTITILLISHAYFKKGKEGDPRSGIEKNMEAVDQAKNIKNMLEEKDRQRSSETY